MKLLDIWINCPDAETADRIAASLLEQRLIACANRHAMVQSQYEWDGQIVSEPETPLLVKTRSDLFEAVRAAVEWLHPYEIPAIVGIEAAYVNTAYLDWVANVTIPVQVSST
ncbi:divalent-cation tolerance protein CutA [Roseibium sp.]|uniref:divalent-cation tolerance protein CutA n=1 Tax=Roseibium sp. TaxID=1936156 RepID=UPI003A97FE36